MTQTELEQLSCDVAAKRGCDPYKYMAAILSEKSKQVPKIWLTDDSAFCFELMVSEKIDIATNDETETVSAIYPEAGYGDDQYYVSKDERYADHNNDANQATRVAILRACLAKGE